MTFYDSLGKLKTILRAATVGIASLPSVAFAQVYSGGGLQEGLGLLTGIGGISSATNIRDIILAIIAFILDIALLLAVLAIIIAGIYLIVSNGDEGQKDKAKKIIQYVIIGIIVILFSRAIVVLVSSIF